MTDADGIALVTGAGGGLGRALALELAARGRRVAALGRGAQGVEETAAMRPEGQILPVVADVSDGAAVRAGFATVAEAGPVTVLINNAAVYPRRDVLDESGESFAETVAINLGGVVNCTRAALEGMIGTGRGRIVNVSTFADMAPLPASSAYAVSKGAGRIFSRALVADLGDRFPGIVVTDWMPGMLATRMGIADGLAPEVAARWGATLALWDDPALNGAVFEMDREVLPPRGLRARVRDMLLLRRRRARVIAGG